MHIELSLAAARCPSLQQPVGMEQRAPRLSLALGPGIAARLERLGWTLLPQASHGSLAPVRPPGSGSSVSKLGRCQSHVPPRSPGRLPVVPQNRILLWLDRRNFVLRGYMDPSILLYALVQHHQVTRGTVSSILLLRHIYIQ